MRRKIENCNYLIIAGAFLIVISQCTLKTKISENKPSKNESPVANDINLDSKKIDTSRIRTMANLLYQRDEYKEALQKYDQLIRVDSLDGESNFRKAFCLAQLDRFTESLPYYL